MAQSKDRVIIFDTTLRDGEQAPGCTMNVDEKVRVAQQLERLGVDVIEAGFPIASAGDFESVVEVGKAVTEPVVAALARCVPEDIERAAGALEDVEKGRIHAFLATSKIHRRFKLKKARSEIVRLAVEGVTQARTCCEDVEFSPEDASRTEPDFLCEVVESVIDAGATTVNIPDTVGYAMPDQFAELVATLMEEVPNVSEAVVSVHCHNDLGLAVANSLAAVKMGARQLECAVNGIGERAGNCALEEVVMALRTRSEFFNVDTAINARQIMNSSRLVSAVTGVVVQRNKAVVGENAFAHEAGIHQNGVLKERSTYEIMSPGEVGRSETELVLGKHSGRHAFRKRLEELGIELPEDHFGHLFEAFKALTDKKKNIYDEDIETLVREELEQVPELYRLVSYHTSSGTNVIPTAAIKMEAADRGVLTDASTGDGPIDAIYRAIDRITGIQCDLTDYTIRAVTRGKDAMGEVSLEVSAEGVKARGLNASTDIIEASARAYVNALNRLAVRMESGGNAKKHGERGQS